MNRLTTTAGVIALSTAALQAATATMPGAGNNKPWSISATLRGFYDDNYATLPNSDPRSKDSFGIEVSPSAGFNWVRDTTSAGLNYVYSMRYFEARPNNKVDHTHQVNAKFSHAFTEQYKTDLSDSFVVAQEPAIIDPSVTTVPIRSEGDNKRNTVNASFGAKLSDTSELVIAYGNSWFDYDQEGSASRSALLDRVEHLPSINFRQVVLPNTVAIVGYQFGVVDYNSPFSITPQPKDFPGLPLGFFPYVPSSFRDNYSHYLFVGVDQRFANNLNGSVRVGGQYTDYHETQKYQNLFPKANLDHNQWSPYVDANLTWTYTQDSYVQVGVRHQRASTDVGVISNDPSDPIPTLDQEATTLYGSWNHQITAKIVGSLIGQYQHGTFEGGKANNLSDDYYLVGLNLAYQINPYLAAEVGYNYDRLESGLDVQGQPRAYDRSRVYIGIRASY